MSWVHYAALPTGWEEGFIGRLHQTVYLINGTAPYYITGINLAYKKISSQLALPTSPELNAFNPNDGLIYQ